MSKTLIDCRHIDFAYEKELILKNLSFTLEAGHMLGVMGPNGGGKSTLLSLIMGRHRPQKGELTVLGKTPGSKELRKDISYLAQEDQNAGYFPLSVSDVLDFAIFKNPSAPKDRPQVLKELELTHLQSALFRELSGGQKQKVLLAKAFLERPNILILDEPTKGLDAKGVDQLLTLIKGWSSKESALPRGAVIVDHNISHLLAHCDRIMCLNRHAHWHDSKDKFNKDIMNDVYHCEYEHLLIHEHGGHSCS